MLSEKNIASPYIAFSLFIAALLCYFVFQTEFLNFWLAITLNFFILTTLVIFLQGYPRLIKELNKKNCFTGIISAFALYFIFWLGNKLIPLFFPFLLQEITSIYELGRKSNPMTISFILIFITSPGEEIFWRGFIQNWFKARFGSFFSLFLASFLYGLVHLASGNLILPFAAFITGLFWGYLYQLTNSLVPSIISHGLWAIGIFLLMPLI